MPSATFPPADSRISEDYRNLLARSRGEEHREEREYLEDKIADAQLLEQEVTLRGNLLVEVTKELIKLQEPVLPLLHPLHEAAAYPGACRGSPSAGGAGQRCSQYRHLQSPFGVYPMKFFVAREHQPQQEGMEAIRTQLSAIVRTEQPDEPYTDEQLAQLLAQDGIFATEELVNVCAKS